MTALKAITIADSLQPNIVDEAVKLMWLSDLEGSIYHEVIAWHEGAGSAPGPCEITTELQVAAPYSMIYAEYLSAMIYMVNGDYESYTNAMMRYNTLFNAYTAWYNRTHMPKQSHRITT